MTDTADQIDAEFPQGTELGRYRLEEVAGQGGMGTVYRAFDPTTNRNVAVKILADGIPATLRTRFLAECEAQARIRHPHIMPVYDQGWLTDERPYFTMELLYDPITLADIVEWTADGSLSKRHPRLRHWADPVRLIKDVVIPAAKGIAVANGEFRVQHRDVKPDNILIDIRTRRPYVIDFGICRPLDEVADEGKIVGTPRFLSTEQARGRVDARTDVWGVGGLVHYVLTGEPPLKRSSPFSRADVAKRISALEDAEAKAEKDGEDSKARGYAERRRQLEAPDFRTLEDLYQDARDGNYLPLPDDVSPAIAAIVAKAMATDPADRYADIDELVEDLEAWVGGGSVQALGEADARGAAVDLARRTLNRHLVTGIATVLALALTAAAAYFIFRKPPSHPDFHATDTLADLERLRSLIDRTAASETAGVLDAGTASATTQRIAREITVLDERIATVPDADARARASAALQGIRQSVESPKLVIGGGGAWVVRDLLHPEHRAHAYDAQGTSLSPGLWRIERRGSPGAAIPVRVPFRAHDGAPAPIKITPPPFPEDVPDGMVWIPGDGQGDLLVQERLVTCEQYGEFLDDLSATERGAHVPPEGFHQGDPGDSTRWLAKTDFQDRPVTGLPRTSMDAFARWRSDVHGVPLRIATDAEWQRFAGTALLESTPDVLTRIVEPLGVALRHTPDGTGEVVSLDDTLVVKTPDGWNGVLPVPASFARHVPYETASRSGFRLVMPLD